MMSTYDPAIINEFATYLALTGVGPAVAALLVFTLGKPRLWHKTLLGWVMASLFLSLVIVYAIILGRRLFGEYPGYEWVAVIGYALTTATLAAIVVIIIRERREGRALGFVDVANRAPDER